MGCTHDGQGLGKLEAPRRNNYFYGKLMDVPHFQMEQAYFKRKRWLMNRLSLGKGVLCGLDVKEKDGLLCVEKGVAIDGFGREIIVSESICINPWEITDECGKPAGKLDPENSHTVYICLAYRECPADFMPVLVTDCETREECAPGTILESFYLLVSTDEPEKLPQLPRERLCRTLFGGREEVRRLRICETGLTTECPAPPKKPCVTLAAVQLLKEGKIGNIDTCTYRPLVYGNDDLFEMLLCVAAQGGTAHKPDGDTTLINVKEISWRHNDEILAGAFPDTFKVTFSNSITAPAEGRAWFIVTLDLPIASAGGLPSSLQAGSQLYRFATSPHPLAGEIKVEDNMAIFTLDSDLVSEIREWDIGDLKLLCRVVVKCDFLLDVQGNKAVDGDHLGGILPSGDGIPGGDFESWFIIKQSTGRHYRVLGSQR